MELRRPEPLLLAAVALLAAGVYLVPLAWGPLPFNVDGPLHVRNSEDLQATGAWPVALHRLDQEPDHSRKLFATSLVLSWASLWLGVEPLEMGQYVVALAAVAGAAGTYLLARHLFRSTLAGATAAGVLVANALFVHQTASLATEQMAHAVIPFLAYLYVRRWDPSGHWALAAPFLVYLPLAHHLSTLVVATLLVLLVVAHHAAGRQPPERLLVDSGVLAAFILAALGWFRYAAMQGLEIVREDAILYLSLLLLISLLLAWASRRHLTRLQASPFLLIPALALAAIVANARFALFDAMRTPPQVLPYLVPILVLLAAAAWGLTLLATRPHPSRALVFGLLAGPFAVIGYAFTQSLDPHNLVVAVRAQTFIQMPVALLAGLGAAHLSRRLPAKLPRARPAAALLAPLLVLLTAASLPPAFGDQDLVGTEHANHPYEWSALAHTAGTHLTITSDMRYAQVLKQYHHVTATADLPFRLAQASEPQAQIVLLREKWRAEGIQAYPLAPVHPDPDAWAQLTQEADTLWVGGPPHDRVLVLRP